MSEQKLAVTLKGSAEIIAKYFGYSINSILYQRGIYDADSFKTVHEYGLPILVSTNTDLNNYLEKLLADVQKWIEKKEVTGMCMLIKNIDDGEVLERWQFVIETQGDVNKNTVREKCQNELQKEIRQIIRQITSTITFLPLLDCPCSFEIILYVDKNLEMGDKWGVTNAGLIDNAKEVDFSSFNTNIHRVSTSVTYKMDD